MRIIADKAIILSAITTTKGLSMSITVPRDLEAENYIIGAALSDEAERDRILIALTPDTFSDLRNQTIFRTIVDIYDQGLNVSPDLVYAKIKDENSRVEINGSYLADLSMMSVSIDARHYIKKILTAYKRRILMLKAQEVVTLASSEEHNIDDTIAEFEDVLYKLQTSENKIDIKSLAEACQTRDGQKFEDYIDKTWERAQQYGEVLRGVPTGYDQLDSRLGGLQRKAFVVLGAGTGMGKTEMMCQILSKMIAKNIPILFFSMEMSIDECSDRFIGINAAVFHGRIERGNYNEETRDRIKHQACVEFQKQKGKCLHICEESSITPETMKAIIRRYKKKYGVQVVVVDHLGLIKFPKGVTSRYEAISHNSRQMKVLAQQLDVCIVAAAQMNREAFKGDKRKPRISDLRDSGNIEQDANQIILLHRDMDDNNQSIDNRMYLNVAKERKGNGGPVTMQFDKATQTMEEIEFMPLELAVHMAKNASGAFGQSKVY